MTDDEHEQRRRREVIAEARRTCERLEHEGRRELMRKVRTTAAAWSPKPEEAKPEPEPRLDTKPPERTDLVYKRNDDVHEVDQPDSDSGPPEIDGHTREDLARMQIVGEELGELIGREQRATIELADQVHELRIEVAKLTSIVAQLREDRALDRSSPIDLPALPRRVN